ncbi:MAG: RNA polymerase sigma factor [Bacteroidales bacterium]|nr:RNA polymerase sigma factor [Bacteroidales bacterium]
MDELYIKKVLNGDSDAFRYFVHNYKDMAFNIAMSVLKSEFDASDVVQEAFLIAYSRLSTFRGDSKFSTWLCRIVINESLKHRKKLSTYDHLHPDIDPANEVAGDEIFDSIEPMEEDQRKYFVELALDRIASREALVLTLYYIEGYQIAEVSDLTGWSLSNVKVILSRGRKSMYAELNRILKSEKQLLY